MESISCLISKAVLYVYLDYFLSLNRKQVLLTIFLSMLPNTSLMKTIRMSVGVSLSLPPDKKVQKIQVGRVRRP